MESEAVINIFAYVTREPKYVDQLKWANFVTFSVAVNEKYKKNGQEVINSQFYEITSNSEKTSKALIDYVKKGQPLFLRGIPRFSIYKDKDGIDKVKVTILLDKFKFLDSNKNATNNEDCTTVNNNTKTNSNKVTTSFDLDDEIPF